MSTTDICQDTDLLVGYVYGECDATERRRVDAHLATCASCAAEVGELKGTREYVREWKVPQVESGVGGLRPVVVQVPAPRWKSWKWIPNWGLAAAAVLVLASAAALANLEVRLGTDGMTIRTGWTAASSTSTSSEASVRPATEQTSATVEMLQDMERRLRADMQASTQSRSAPEPAAASQAVRDGDALIARVRALIEASERRQQRELALRLTHLLQDFDRQRQADLTRIQYGLGQLETFTGAEAARQRELMNQLIRVSQQQR